MTLIRPATTPDDLAAVRQLCWDYRTHLNAASPIDAQITETFYPVPKYTALMDTIATEHARPKGIILLATLDNQPVGCAMTHALDAHSAEIKRLYVAPHARGHGIARKLVTACMEQARTDGFTRILLDTSVTLIPARALYTAMGFSQRGPYQNIPADVLPHLVFFEAAL
ncbi:GNAT family N-acetyltransferase [uncultured Sulfitobacter sp.]|uniref:GNAT family N-acetyltransferase n=1 Tax=uncultured Sulfitobacter sp. TaxID=191468 RepID=UPI002602EA98|nr:GNAT family N-acetyltransferase [uncultured Sulfitobacter sp.]